MCWRLCSFSNCALVFSSRACLLQWGEGLPLGEEGAAAEGRGSPRPFLGGFSCYSVPHAMGLSSKAASASPPWPPLFLALSSHTAREPAGLWQPPSNSTHLNPVPASVFVLAKHLSARLTSLPVARPAPIFGVRALPAFAARHATLLQPLLWPSTWERILVLGSRCRRRTKGSCEAHPGTC